jgi:glycerol-3-phosphate dehydrogenase
LSREHTILVSKAGLVTVTGGKWTTYRRMAQDVVDTAIQHQLLTQATCRTESLPLHGAAGLAPSQEHAGTPDSYYGSDLPALKALPGADRMLVRSSGLSEAHVRFAARYELARSAEDVLARRNRALFLDSEAAMLAAPEVARILAEELGHDAAWQQRTLQELAVVAANYRLK